MLSLTEDEYAVVARIAAPVALDERDAFLLAVGAELGRHQAVGIGLVSRVAAELQQKFPTPARADAVAGAPRHDQARDRNRARQRVEVEA
jgi:hypothetical protein